MLLQHQAKWWLPDARGDTALELAVAANSHDAMIIIQTFAKDTGVQTILRNKDFLPNDCHGLAVKNTYLSCGSNDQILGFQRISC